MGIVLLMCATGFLVVISIMYGMIRNLQKSNREQRRLNTVLKSRASLDTSALSGFLTQDPIAAYRLLEDHVSRVKKRKN